MNIFDTVFREINFKKCHKNDVLDVPIWPSSLAKLEMTVKILVMTVKILVVSILALASMLALTVKILVVSILALASIFAAPLEVSRKTKVTRNECLIRVRPNQIRMPKGHVPDIFCDFLSYFLFQEYSSRKMV